MGWSKNLPAERATAYQKTFTNGLVGQYTDASEQQPVVTSMRRADDVFLLDAGCGSGRFLANAARGQRFVGMDVSLEMVKLARADLGRGLFVVGELERLPFKDGTFDEVICSRVLQHIRDQARAIRELARVCRTGGGAIVLSLNSWTLHCLYKNLRLSRVGRILDLPFRLLRARRSPFAKWPFHYDNYCSLPELCRLFRKAGLTVTETKGGTIGSPWMFHSFGWGRLIQRYAYRHLRWYFRACRLLEDRLGPAFPFRYFMDKVIVKGLKRPVEVINPHCKSARATDRPEIPSLGLCQEPTA